MYKMSVLDINIGVYKSSNYFVYKLILFLLRDRKERKVLIGSILLNYLILNYFFLIYCNNLLILVWLQNCNSSHIKDYDSPNSLHNSLSIKNIPERYKIADKHLKHLYQILSGIKCCNFTDFRINSNVLRNLSF